MRDDQYRFLTIYGQLPARLSTEQAAWVLGFAAHDIPVLIGAGLLKPLGRPPRNGVKYFATMELETLRNDSRWLAKASDAGVNHWRTKNASRRRREPSDESIVGQVARPGDEIGVVGCDR